MTIWRKNWNAIFITMLQITLAGLVRTDRYIQIPTHRTVFFSPMSTYICILRTDSKITLIVQIENHERFVSSFSSLQPFHLQPDSSWCDSPFKELNYPLHKHCPILNFMCFFIYSLFSEHDMSCSVKGRRKVVLRIPYSLYTLAASSPCQLVMVANNVTRSFLIILMWYIMKDYLLHYCIIIYDSFMQLLVWP